ncbi:response regulator transcription factor [uncultured Rossellomorea sp.]|uniref:response regulator transcription factor n=1 Tax=uncultured Rossellomorea sp. TaxID=2837549 RepID=UPI0026044B20|nr:response regulator transcription factor [uncultured Rossellomorea sp.]
MIRVMLVDDEPLILEGLKYILDWEDLGFTIVATAKDGLEALKLSREVEFDVLITDIKMPELTGLELIEKINKGKESIKSIILSGFQEFDLVKKGLELGIENYLLKPINEEELLSTILHLKEKIDRISLEEESILILRDHSIWRWLMGKMTDNDFKERISFYPRVNIQTPLRLGLVKTELEEAIHLQKTIEEETSTLAVTTPSGDILLIWSEESFEAEKAEVSLIVEHECNGKEHVVVMSRRVDVIDDAQKVFRELEMACELKMLLPDQDHRIAEEMHLKTSTSDKQTINYLKPDILEHLANQEYDAVRKYLSGTFTQLEQDKEVFIIKSMMLEYFFQMKNKFLISLEYTQYVQLIHQILYLHGKEDALAIMDQCIRYIEQEDSGEERKSPIIQTVLTYIHQNYSEDMSLKTLGHRFHINPIYLGQLFQKEVKDSFTKYLNHLRIDRAKKLLMTSHEKAGHIGKKVGYTDATYFYKQFKKYERATPSEWRKQHSQA